ncbi:MAG TPA: Ger(x)C family spore germination protein [Clostridiaceae bacterium]|nr:Ger(x)C family spore germination protein [Clostridiaceae bacterium]
MKRSRNVLTRIIKTVLLLFALLLSTGCWDYQDINRRTISVAFGVDKVDGNYEYSTEVAKLTSDQGQAQGNIQIPRGYFILSGGKNLEMAKIDYSYKIPLEDFTGGVRIALFGENFAREGIEAYVNRLDNIYGYRKTTAMAVSRETPRDLLQTRVKSDISTGFYIYDMIISLSDIGHTLYRNLGDVLKYIATKEVGFLLPYIGKEGDDIVYLGLAVIKNSKLVDILEGDDAKGVLYLLAEKKPLFSEAIPTEGNKNLLSFRVYARKKKIKTEYKDNRVIINLDITLNADLGYEYYFNPITKEDVKNFEIAISDRVENMIKNSILKSQKDYECDIFQFARHFQIQHPKIFEKIEWINEYPKAQINVSVNTKITSLGFLDPNAKSKF